MGILALINALLPTITGVITLIRHPDGTLTLVQILDQADAQFDANLTQAAGFEAQIKAKMAAAKPPA